MMRKIVTICAATLVVALTASAQTISIKGERIVSRRPLADLSRHLEKISGRVVTYEEPLPRWRDELEGDANKKWDLVPKQRAVLLPRKDASLSQALEEILTAFDRETDGSQYEVEESSWGFHIVPRSIRDEAGRLQPTQSLLDSLVSVPTEARTPSGHLRSLAAGVTYATGVRVEVSAIPGSRSGFDIAFRSAPATYEWGVLGKTAREALIDLLARSATTFSWRFNCQYDIRPADRFCVLNLERLILLITDQSGEQTEQVLNFDRCADCPARREGQQ